MTPLAPTRQTRAVKGGHDAVPPPNRKPFSIPAQKHHPCPGCWRLVSHRRSFT